MKRVAHHFKEPHIQFKNVDTHLAILLPSIRKMKLTMIWHAVAYLLCFSMQERYYQTFLSIGMYMLGFFLRTVPCRSTVIGRCKHSSKTTGTSLKAGAKSESLWKKIEANPSFRQSETSHVIQSCVATCAFVPAASVWKSGKDKSAETFHCKH